MIWVDPRGLYQEGPGPDQYQLALEWFLDMYASPRPMWLTQYFPDPPPTPEPPTPDPQGARGVEQRVTQGPFGTSSRTALGIAAKARTLIANQTSWSPECQELLGKFDTTGEALSAAARRVILYDGTSALGGGLLYSSLFRNTSAFRAVQARYGDLTISQFFADTLATTGKAVKAVAAALGDEVFINPSYWGGVGNFDNDWATMLHELIHNVTDIVDGARFTGDLSNALKDACRL